MVAPIPRLYGWLKTLTPISSATLRVASPEPSLTTIMSAPGMEPLTPEITPPMASSSLKAGSIISMRASVFFIEMPGQTWFIYQGIEKVRPWLFQLRFGRSESVQSSQIAQLFGLAIWQSIRGLRYQAVFQQPDRLSVVFGVCKVLSGGVAKMGQ